MKSIGEYIAEHSTQETEALAWIEKQTHIRTNHARMLTGAVQGRFLKMLVEATSPQNILEIGTFTGYSAVCIAYGLPAGGHLDTLEINDELEDLIAEGLGKAGVEEKVSLHIGDAKETLARLKNTCGTMYDMVYMDANKREYPEYYDLVFPLVRPGGYILADSEKPTPDVILIGTGSEVEQCMQAKEILKTKGVDARVVSMPCIEEFEKQPQSYKDAVLPPEVKAP